MFTSTRGTTQSTTWIRRGHGRGGFLHLRPHFAKIGRPTALTRQQRRTLRRTRTIQTCAGRLGPIRMRVGATHVCTLASPGRVSGMRRGPTIFRRADIEHVDWCDTPDAYSDVQVPVRCMVYDCHFARFNERLALDGRRWGGCGDDRVRAAARRDGQRDRHRCCVDSRWRRRNDRIVAGWNYSCGLGGGGVLHDGACLR